MSPVFSLTCLIYILDKMAVNMNKESEITSTVEDTWFVIIPEDEIKLENAKIQGKLYNFVHLLLKGVFAKNEKGYRLNTKNNLLRL